MTSLEAHKVSQPCPGDECPDRQIGHAHTHYAMVLRPRVRSRWVTYEPNTHHPACPFNTIQHEHLETSPA